MEESLKKIEEQHLKNYRLALSDTIQDNTDILIEEDLILLLKEPPLASMDTLRSKILSKAKDYGIILSDKQLTKIVQQFRDNMASELPEIGNIRKQTLQNKLDEMLKSSLLFTKEELVAVLNQAKDQVKNLFGTKLENHIQEELIPQLPSLVELAKNNNLSHNDSFLQDISDYITFRYPSHIEKLLESKISLKDQTLLNRLLEHQERYQFTKEKSHLFHEKIKK